MKLIGQIELQRCCCSRCKIPQEVDKNRWIDGLVLHQPLDLSNEIRASGLRFVIGVAKDRTMLPETQQGDKQSEHSHYRERLLRRQMFGYVSGRECSLNHGNDGYNVPKRAQAS